MRRRRLVIGMGVIAAAGCAWCAPGTAGQTLAPGTSPLYTISNGVSETVLSPDIDGDGYGDTLSSYALDDTAGNDAGAAWVYSGIDGSLLYQYFGVTAGARLGTSIDTCDDLDGDGVTDFLIGSPCNGGCTGSGAVDVVSGRTGTILYTLSGVQSHEGLGFRVAGGGDVDLDGLGDFAVNALLYGTPSDTNEGAVRVYSGIDGSQLYLFEGSQAGESYGQAIAMNGDIDADGRSDLLVGSWEWDLGPMTSAGKVEVFSGADGSLLYQQLGSSTGYSLGYDVLYTGDLTDDGRDEFLVSAVGAVVNEKVQAGEVMLMDPSSGSTLWTLQGENANAGLGVHLRWAGDMHSDGTDDVLIGEWDPDTMFFSEIVHTVDVTQGTIWGAFRDDQNCGCFAGGAEDGGQDLTGDGLPDIAIRMWPDLLTFQANSLSVTGNPAPGATVFFDHNAPAAASDPFLVVLSFGQAGVPLGVRTIPLSPDPLFLASFGAPGLGGMLDGQGQASQPFAIPANPNLSGLTFYAASLLVDFAYPLGVRAITNAAAVAIQ